MAVKTKKNRKGVALKSGKTRSPATRKTVKTTSPKSSVTKKNSAPKTAARKSPLKTDSESKPVAKKTAVKTTTKKAPAKKTAAKKTPERKKAAKKTAKTTSELLKAIKARGKETDKKTGDKPAQKTKSATARPARKKAAAKKPIPIVPPMQKPVEIVVGSPKPQAKKSRAKFSKSALDIFKKELLQMRDHFTGQTSAMKHDALQRDDEVNPEEDGTDAFMRLQALNQMNDQQHIVSEIDEALGSIEKGTYGICEMCGCLISKLRLKARPFSKFCVTCKSEMELGGRRKKQH